MDVSWEEKAMSSMHRPVAKLAIVMSLVGALHLSSAAAQSLQSGGKAFRARHPKGRCRFSRSEHLLKQKSVVCVVLDQEDIHRMVRHVRG